MSKDYSNWRQHPSSLPPYSVRTPCIEDNKYGFIKLKEVYTVTYLYKNGCVTINQHFTENLKDLTTLIIEDLTSPKHSDLSEGEKNSLKLSFFSFNHGFELVPIDDTVNVWYFPAAAYIDIYIIKTSNVISR
jgi:hypothetical protein